MSDQSDVAKDIKDRAYRRMRHLEWSRILKKAEEASIPIDVVRGFTQDNFADFLDPKSHEEAEAAAIAEAIWHAAGTWALTNAFLVIEGGTPKSRYRLGCACLFRGIIAHARGIDRIAASYDMAELMTHLAGFPSEMSEKCERLRRLPCLWVREIEPKQKFARPECRQSFDSILKAREGDRHPTILTLAGDDHEFQTTGYTEWGSKFAEVMMTCHNPKVGIWRLHARIQ